MAFFVEVSAAEQSRVNCFELVWANIFTALIASPSNTMSLVLPEKNSFFSAAAVAAVSSTIELSSWCARKILNICANNSRPFRGHIRARCVVLEKMLQIFRIFLSQHHHHCHRQRAADVEMWRLWIALSVLCSHGNPTIFFFCFSFKITQKWCQAREWQRM